MTTFLTIVLALGFALTPLGDLLTTRASTGAPGDGDGRYSLVVRGCVMAALLCAMLLDMRIKPANWTLVALASVPLAASTVFFLGDEMSPKELLEQTLFVLKVFSFFIYVAALSELGDRQLSKLEPYVVIALLVYAAAIVAGAALSIDMFRSYQADTAIRSGYKGIVNAQNEASAVVIAGLAYGYTRVLRSGWRLLDVLLVGALLVSSLLIGTKAGMVGAMATTAAYLYARHSAFHASMRAAMALALLACIAFAAYLAVPAVSEAVDLSMGYFTYQYDHTNGNALLSMLLSGRDMKFATMWDELARHDFVPLLGGGYPVVRYLVELDAADLMICFGVPVFILYFVALRKAFVAHRRDGLGRFGMHFFLVVLFISCTAGHVLNSAVVSPYLAFIAVVVRRGRVRQTNQGDLS